MSPPLGRSRSPSLEFYHDHGLDAAVFRPALPRRRQDHNRNRSECDGRTDRDEVEIRDWAREHDLPYFDAQVHLPDYAVGVRKLKGPDANVVKEVTLTFASWNQIHGWLRRLEGLRRAA